MTHHFGNFYNIPSTRYGSFRCDFCWPRTRNNSDAADIEKDVHTHVYLFASRCLFLTSLGPVLFQYSPVPHPISKAHLHLQKGVPHRLQSLQSRCLLSSAPEHAVLFEARQKASLIDLRNMYIRRKECQAPAPYCFAVFSMMTR